MVARADATNPLGRTSGSVVQNRFYVTNGLDEFIFYSLAQYAGLLNFSADREMYVLI